MEWMFKAGRAARASRAMDGSGRSRCWYMCVYAGRLAEIRRGLLEWRHGSSEGLATSGGYDEAHTLNRAGYSRPEWEKL